MLWCLRSQHYIIIIIIIASDVLSNAVIQRESTIKSRKVTDRKRRVDLAPASDVPSHAVVQSVDACYSVNMVQK